VITWGEMTELSGANFAIAGRPLSGSGPHINGGTSETA